MTTPEHTPPRRRDGDTATPFSFGDRVIHATKPEWGSGVVSKVQNLVRDGQPSQSLTVRFERAGLKTVSTAHADIRPAVPLQESSTTTGADAPAAPQGEGWLDQAANQPPDRAMAKLPEPCTDPFASPEARLRATIDQYRFTNAGASLLDWAAAQTGLADPLSRFARHELEQFFIRYADARDNHLRATAEELRRKDPAALTRLTAAAPPAARQALSRQHARR